ncbi:hypothetical protein Aduo_008466 [Ancylostoma duodenale]
MNANISFKRICGELIGLSTLSLWAEMRFSGYSRSYGFSLMDKKVENVRNQFLRRRYGFYADYFPSTTQKM